jgi:LPS-assembly lipoprotein
MITRFQLLFFSLFFSLMLSACGFHLSGYGKSTLPFESLSLETSQPYSHFTKALQKALEAAGVHTTLATPAPARLQILAQNFTRTTTSLGNAGQTATYLLVYTLLFQLVDRTGNILLMPQQVRVTRSFSITSNQLDGDLNTENDLKENMQQDVIQQIIIRLASPQLRTCFAAVPTALGR